MNIKEKTDMKKLTIILSLLMMTSAILFSCENGSKPAETGDKSSAEVTTDKKDETTPAESTGVSEEEQYYYNPKLVKCYRKNDRTILFALDTKVKDPDGNLFEHIYIAKTADGEPIANAVSVDSYGGELSDIWGANFDSDIPETVWLCIRALDSENKTSPDIKTALCDVVELGVYGGIKLADGTRVAAIETGKDVIEAKLWTEANINFDKDPDVIYHLPGENDVFLLHEADNQSVLLAAWSGAGASVELTFTGTSVNIYNNVENDSVTNDLKVYLDGELIETLDGRKAFSVVREGLSAGQHTVKLISGENSTTVSETQGENNKWMFYISGIRYSND